MRVPTPLIGKTSTCLTLSPGGQGLLLRRDGHLQSQDRRLVHRQRPERPAGRQRPRRAPTITARSRCCDDRLSPVSSRPCLLYTSDAADDLLCVDLGGRRIIKKKKK